MKAPAVRDWMTWPEMQRLADHYAWEHRDTPEQQAARRDLLAHPE